MKKSIKIIVLVAILFVFSATAVGAYYRSGWYNCKSWTCGRYTADGRRVDFFWSGKHIQIRAPFQVRVIQVKNFWTGRISYYRATMGRSYTLNHPDLWVRMSEWEPVGGH